MSISKSVKCLLSLYLKMISIKDYMCVETAGAVEHMHKYTPFND